MPNLQKLDLKRLKEILTEEHEITLEPPKIPERFRRIKSFRDFWNALTWRDIECIAALPALIFFLCPLYFFYRVLDPNRWIMWAYVSDTIYFLCVVTGVPALLLAIGKCCCDRTILRQYSRQNRITAGCFLIFVLLMILHTDIYGWSELEIFGNEMNYESTLTYLSYFLIFFWCSAIIRSSEVKRIIVYFGLLTSLQQGVLNLIDGLVCPLSPMRIAWPGGYSSVYFNPNHYGYYLTVGIMLSVGVAAWDKQRVWRILGALSFAVQSVVLNLNNTLGCFLAVLVGIVFMAIMDRIVKRKISRRVILLFCAYIGLAVFVSVFDRNIFDSIREFGFDLSKLLHDSDDKMLGGSGRVVLWYYTILFIIEKPLLGYGVEGIAGRLSDAAGLVRAHNIYLEYTSFFGIPAMLLFLIGIFCIFLNGLKKKAVLDDAVMTILAAAFGFAVSGCFGISIFYTTPYFFILLGLGFSIIPSGKTDSQ